MALGMKHWIGLTVAGCAAVALWLLPPATWATVRTVPVTSVQKRAAELGRDARRTRLTLQRLRWSDSLSALALATEKDGLAVSGAPGLVTPGQLDSIRGTMETELARLPTRNGDAVVGFFVVPIADAWQGPHPPLMQRREVYLGVRGGRPYCLGVFASRRPVPLQLVMSTARPGMWGGEGHTDPLGACRLVAAYGSPGPTILTWLKRGGIAYAYDTGSPSSNAMSEWSQMSRRQIFGLRFGPIGGETLLGDRCRAGIEKACLTAFLSPASRGTPLGYEPPVGDAHGMIFPEGTPFPLGPPSEYLLADLQHQFGPRRFQAFWSSDADVPTAFRTAFGRPLDGWLMTWMSGHEPITTAGPGLHGGDVLGMLLVLALAGLIVSAWTRRRRVG